MNDIEAVVQSVLDQAELQQYFHPEQDDRIPLRIVHSGTIFDGVSVSKFGDPVEFVNRPGIDVEKDAYIEIESFEIAENEATVRFRYAVEGIVGRTYLAKEQGVWSIENTEIVEE